MTASRKAVLAFSEGPCALSLRSRRTRRVAESADASAVFAMDGRSAAAPAAPPNCRSNSLRSMRIALFPSFMQRLSRHEGFWICGPADRKSLDPGNSARKSSPGYNIGGSRSKHDLKTVHGRDLVYVSRSKRQQAQDHVVIVGSGFESGALRSRCNSHFLFNGLTGMGQKAVAKRSVRCVQRIGIVVHGVSGSR